MVNADKVILRILAGLGQRVHATKLVKLVYLVDYLYFQHFGRTLTGFQYMWDHYGPNAVGHGIVSQATELAEKGLVHITEHPNIYGGTSTLFKIAPDGVAPTLSPEAEMILEDVLQQYSKLSITEITAVTKRTVPFKKAARYGLLSMAQTAPAERTTRSDWAAYQRELKELGTVPLEDLEKRYGMT